jgi:hypothetical protein
MDQLKSYDEVIGEKKDEINDIRRRDIFRKIKSLEKFYNIVVHICSSANRTKEFKNLIKIIIPL